MNNQDALEAFQRQTDELYNSLADIPGNPSLQEVDFVNYFLPYFTGQKPITREDNPLKEWIAIAGTPLNPVNILDSKQNVLFTVPGLYNSNVIPLITNREEHSYSQILSEFNLLNSNAPPLASRFLQSKLAEKASKIENTDEATKVWKFIYERYNLAEKNTVSSTKEKEIDVEY